MVSIFIINLKIGILLNFTIIHSALLWNNKLTVTYLENAIMFYPTYLFEAYIIWVILKSSTTSWNYRLRSRIKVKSLVITVPIMHFVPMKSCLPTLTRLDLRPHNPLTTQFRQSFFLLRWGNRGSQSVQGCTLVVGKGTMENT